MVWMYVKNGLPAFTCASMNANDSLKMFSATDGLFSRMKFTYCVHPRSKPNSAAR
jgi:hypothetical protein